MTAHGWDNYYTAGLLHIERFRCFPLSPSNYGRKGHPPSPLDNVPIYEVFLVVPRAHALPEGD